MGPLSNGGLLQAEYSGRRSWSARVHGDSIIFRQLKGGLLLELLEVGALVGLGALLSSVF